MNADDNRRIARNTIFLYIRTFVAMVIGLYTSRMILEVLGVSDFGIYNVVGGLIAMMAFVNGSFNVAIGRYLTFELGRKDFAAYNRVFNTSLVIQCCLALLVLVVAETVGLWFVNHRLVIPVGRLTAANWVYQAAIIGMILSIINSPFSATINAHERMNVVAYVGIGESFAKLAIVISLYWWNYDKLIIWAILFLMITVASVGIQMIYVRRQFPHTAVNLRHDRSIVKSMATFSGWNMFGTIAWTLKDQGINIVLNLFGGPVINAARGVSYQVKSAILSLQNGFQSAVNPQLTKNYAADDLQATHRLLCRSSKISFFLLLIPAIPVCFEVSFLLGLWLVEVPGYAPMFTVLVISEALIEVFGGPSITALMATGKIKWYQIVVGSILLLNLPVAYLLLKVGCPIWTPFIVAIVMTATGHLARLKFISRQLLMPLRVYFRDVIGRCLLVASVSVIVPLAIYLAMPQGYLRIIILVPASLLSTGITIWVLGLDAGERNFVRNAITSRLSRKKKSIAS